jgi:hypothetical protein
MSSCSDVESSRSKLSEEEEETPPFAEEKLIDMLSAGAAMIHRIIKQFIVMLKSVPAIMISSNLR